MNYTLALEQMKLEKRMRRPSWAAGSYIFYGAGTVIGDVSVRPIVMMGANGNFSIWNEPTVDKNATDWVLA